MMMMMMIMNMMMMMMIRLSRNVGTAEHNKFALQDSLETARHNLGVVSEIQ